MISRMTREEEMTENVVSLNGQEQHSWRWDDNFVGTCEEWAAEQDRRRSAGLSIVTPRIARILEARP